MRIAMWSGPRNLSTALMYSFAARQDCFVVDEPFYASFLHQTGASHPLSDEIIASQPTDPLEVIAHVNAPTPAQYAHSYCKLMTHHMLPGTPRDWIQEFTNVFLIRHPARVLASYVQKHENPGLEDTGLRQQAQIFEAVRDQNPVVIDSHDIRRNPRAALKALCDAIDLDFKESMLSWPKGGHLADGVWARHWYGSVWNSSGFASSEGPVPELKDAMAEVVERALPFYNMMKERCLQVDEHT